MEHISIDILQALPRESLRALDKFMQSPYHVTHTDTQRLYAYLRNVLPSHHPGKEEIVTKLFPNEPAAHTRLYHLFHYLSDAIERFLALEQLENDADKRHLATVEALRNLNLREPGAAMFRYAQRKLLEKPGRGSAFYRNDYLLQLEAYRLSLDQGRDKSFNVQHLATAQDIAYIVEKLKTGSLLLSHEAISKQNFDKGLLESVLTYLTNHPLLEIPVVALYYHGYYTQLGEQGEYHFSRLKALLRAHASLLSADETHDLYLMAINYCIRQINQFNEVYFQEIFELYQSGLEHGALLDNGYLSRWTYNNITATALRLRAYTWVEQFLYQYAPLLPEQHRDGTLHINLARFCYEAGRNKEALQHLIRREYDDLLQNLLAKTLLAKIYYEMDEHNALENHLDSIQIYLRRKKVLGYHKENYTAIVRFMRKLLAVNRNIPAEIETLRGQIEAAPTLTERDWFLKQLDA